MSELISLVIVPVDDSPTAHAATRHAALLSHLLHAPLRLVHVMPLNPAEFSDIPANRQAEKDRDRSQRLAAARNAFASARQAIEPTLDSPPEEVTLEEEGFVHHPARTLVDYARRHEGCLLVVGARHLSDLGKFVEGSISDEVVHKAPCPVTVVHPEAVAEDVKRIGRVVVPVDGSRHSDNAARLAGDLARSAGARVDLLFCRPAGAPPPQKDKQDESEQLFAQAQQRLGEIPAGIATHLLEGDRYAEAITEFAHSQPDNPVIVMGRRGLGTLREKLVGSVSHHAIDLAHCPITVVV
ncbi:universal stress protein [Halomonas sp. MCCC 1A11036]|uniref:Universal stress protein n=1 Tax=Billgrantia zhangzhouensis TaxID=2733481 RepID=A0ABS9AGW4_9GAMM|nr:universal stress protein [Halomonas zhangzhouensis]MCE8021011.1 universal stress protein [Halomonas zhangzhouensis]